MFPPIINLLGPTATGKTEIALEIASELPVSIISVDSALIYRGMNIGTAKPSQAQRQKVPHYLIDICNPETSFSAGDFANIAWQTIQKIHQAQRIPLLVGGTMLYFKALYQGLANLPLAQPVARQYISGLAKRYGWPHCHQILQQVDPVCAQQIQPTDPQRIQRALEIYYSMGKTLSGMWQNTHPRITTETSYITIALYPQQRNKLHQRIAQRFEHMMAEGFINEMETIMQSPMIHSALPAMRTVGYRQAWAYLTGKITFEEMQNQAIAATRQLAKRQLTWLKSWPNIDYQFDPFEDTNIAQKVVDIYQNITTI